MPLVEIVTGPDMRSAAAAADFFSRLRAILVALGVNDGNLEEGSLRCDANVSVRPVGRTELGIKAEIKNLNSFRFVQKAIEYEIERQIERRARAADAFVQETRLWDADAGRTVSMRSKEEAHDYRYFPEPDLPPLRIARAEIERLRGELPELPDARSDAARRAVRPAGLRRRRADAARRAGRLLRGARRAAAGNAKAASNWIMGELLRQMNAASLEIERVPGHARGARRADPPGRRRHDQRPDRQGGIRDDVRVGRVGRGDRRSATGSPRSATRRAVLDMVRGDPRASTPTRSSSIARASRRRSASSSAR